MGDRRTLFAFLLIGLIFVLMPHYYEWMGLAPSVPGELETTPSSIDEAESRYDYDGPKETAGATESSKDKLIPATRSPDIPPTAATPPVPELATQTQLFTPQRVTVETPLQILTFSTAGGVLTSVQLPMYERQPGETVELMPARGFGLGVQLRDENGHIIRNLDDAEFVPNASVLSLQPGMRKTLEMRALLGEGRSLVKRFHFDANRYGIDIELAYTGFDEQTFVYLVWEGGIAIAEREESVDLESMRAMAYLNESLKEHRADEDEPLWVEKGSLRWVGVRNKYFMSSLAPRTSERHIVELETRKGQPVPKHDYRIGLRMARSGTWESLLYLGPLDYEGLVEYEVEMERAMDLGFPVVREISKVLIVLFVAAHSWIPNYGWVIVLFAVAVKIIVYPLTHKSYESAAKMAAVQPKVTALKEKYKNDTQRLSKETMKLYSAEGVNPLSSCLPLLMQMPIFIALYQTFSSTIELRQSPFILWIDDLSLPDEILIGGMPIHVLPLLMSAAMFFQSKMTMKDPKQAALVYLMPVVMVFIMWRFSSGLVLYWTVFNVLQIGQQHLTNYLKQRRA